MVRHLSIAAVLSLAVLAASTRAAAPESYGAGVTLADTTSIDRILANPASFEGKTVKVEGTVQAVCTHMGCWMALAPDAAKNGDTVLIKVDDGGPIVFPVSAKGKRAAAQGIVQRVGGDPEGQSAAAEAAKAQGKSEAPVAWQIKATGAVVY